MSSPASALISSTATGWAQASYTAVAKELPALGWGTTFTMSSPGTASCSVMMARFRCSQHWAAMYTPIGANTLCSPSKIALATSGVDQLPTLRPTTSLVLQPTTTICPFRSRAASASSFAASAACCRTSSSKPLFSTSCTIPAIENTPFT